MDGASQNVTIDGGDIFESGSSHDWPIGEHRQSEAISLSGDRWPIILERHLPGTSFPNVIVESTR